MPVVQLDVTQLRFAELRERELGRLCYVGNCHGKCTRQNPPTGGCLANVMKLPGGRPDPSGAMA